MHAGQAIYLRWPSRYHLAEGEPTSFGQIEELCRMKSETAIGYITEVRPSLVPHLTVCMLSASLTPNQHGVSGQTAGGTLGVGCPARPGPVSGGYHSRKLRACLPAECALLSHPPHHALLRPEKARGRLCHRYKECWQRSGH